MGVFFGNAPLSIIMIEMEVTIRIDFFNRTTTNQLIKPHTGFTLDYLDYNQREKIVKHLKAGKTLKCHNKNCNSFNEEFSALYEYNIHCHTTHKRQPLHPELSLIELLNLEPRGNPWEDNSCSVSIIETKR